MMNRSVMGRQMFQDGGMAMPDPMAETMPMDPAMGGNPDNPNNLDENVVNEAMMAAAQDFGNVDDADDYEGMINAIRGDKAPMAERVNELAELVGLEDAQQTPESVVALIQPVMLLNSMDQGIGSIAEGVMDTEMSGDMTGGIMSTVNMEPPMEPAMAQPMPMDPGMGMPMGMEAGNEPPVNFRQGGAVQHFAPENDERVVQPGSLTANFRERQDLYNSLIPPQSYDDEDIERQREMTQAQMLFDIAGTALAFATPGSTQMSPAQRLAEAATETKLFDKIGARAQGQLSADQARKKSMRDEKMKMDLLALGSAETMTTAQAKARADAVARGASSDPSLVTFIDPNNLTDFHTIDKNDKSPENVARMAALRKEKNSDGNFKYRITGNYTAPTDKTGAEMVNFVNTKTGATEMVDLSLPAGKRRANELKTLGYLKGGLASVADQNKTPKIQVYVNTDNTNDILSFDLNNPVEREAANALGANYLPTTMPSIDDLKAGSKSSLGNSYAAKALEMISNAETLKAYANGTLDETEANIFNNYLTNEMRLKPFWNPQTQQTDMTPGLTVSSAVMDAIDTRSRIPGASLPTIGSQGGLDTGDGTTGRIRFNDDNSIDFSSFENEPLFIVTGIDLTQSQGMMSSVNRVFNQLAGQVQDITGLGSGYRGESGKITSKADTQLDNLARKIITTARSGVAGRIFALDVEMLQGIVNGFQPGGFKTDTKARDALVAVRNNLALMYSEAQSRLTFTTDQKQVTEIRRLRSSVESLIAETTGAIAIYDKFIMGDPIADTIGDRASSVTSSLTRSSAGSNP